MDPCSVTSQDCPAGDKCVWSALSPGGLRRDFARCIEVTGDIEPFEPCSLPNGIGVDITDDCNAESYCLDVYGTADHGFCAPFTTASYQCDAYPETDPAVENGSDFPAACLYYDCHPLLPNSCPEGLDCAYYPAFLYGSLMCWNVPLEYDLPVGAACDYGQCGEGQLCAWEGWLPDCAEERCCTQFCDLDAPVCTTPGTQCEPYLSDFQGDGGSVLLGACVLPGSFM